MLSPMSTPPSEKVSPASPANELDRLVARIVERLDPEEIWLFGSRAEGRARPGSDYDLLAVVPDRAPELDLDFFHAWTLICDLGIPADLVPYTRAEFEEERDVVGTLAQDVAERGRRVYERCR
jgi:predicted nucleotidyltransferase